MTILQQKKTIYALQKSVLYFFIYILFAFVAVVSVGPLIWVMLSSFKTNG